jgi:hypothetical protein
MSTHGIKPFEDVAFLRQEVLRLMDEVHLTDLQPAELEAIVNILGAALIRLTKPVFRIEPHELSGLSDLEGTIAP